MTVLRDNSWGKAGVRLVHVRREGDWHELRDLDITTSLSGDTTEAYASGSNAEILTTDAQKNAVYAFAAEHPPSVPEQFADRLAHYFLTSLDSIEAASVTVEQRDWRRVSVEGKEMPHSFAGGNSDHRIARVDVAPGVSQISAGLRRLPLLNTTGAEFLGFPRDRFTVGNGAADRILATELSARWDYSVQEAAFDELYGSVRKILVETFASVYSKSIQFSMRCMADAVLEAHAEIQSLTLTFPNLHHYAVDVSQFGIESHGEVFVTAPEPHSLIEATFSR